jgi:hypothetical protein
LSYRAATYTQSRSAFRRSRHIDDPLAIPVTHNTSKAG